MELLLYLLNIRKKGGSEANIEFLEEKNQVTKKRFFTSKMVEDEFVRYFLSPPPLPYTFSRSYGKLVIRVYRTDLGPLMAFFRSLSNPFPDTPPQEKQQQEIEETHILYGNALDHWNLPFRIFSRALAASNPNRPPPITTAFVENFARSVIWDVGGRRGQG